MKKQLAFLFSGLMLSASAVFAQTNTFPTTGFAGMGTLSPTANFDLRLPGLALMESGMRITAPFAFSASQNGPSSTIQSLFHIRRSPLFGTSYKTHFIVNNSGRVGISTDILPQYVKLHVKDGFILVDGSQGSLLFDKSSTSTYGQWGVEYLQETGLMGGLNFWKPSGSTNGTGGGGFGNYYMFLADNGKIGMGVTPDQLTNASSGYRLHVKDGIITEKVKVELVANWADFVFAPDYELRTLQEVECFIDENGHLPDIPSAEVVEEEGIDVAEMDARLLQKIEELTLYLIALKKENEQLSADMEALKLMVSEQ